MSSLFFNTRSYEMKVKDLWTISYERLSDMRMRALIKLSRSDCPDEEKPTLRRICEIWKLRSDNECI